VHATVGLKSPAHFLNILTARLHLVLPWLRWPSRVETFSCGRKHFPRKFSKLTGPSANRRCGRFSRLSSTMNPLSRASFDALTFELTHQASVRASP
jgi:hypothetical protein